MFPAPLHRRISSLPRSPRRALCSISLSSLAILSVLPIAALPVRADSPSAGGDGKAHIVLAQLKQEDHNKPAAAPQDRPRALQLPTGPTIGPPPGGTNTPGTDNSSTLAPQTTLPATGDTTQSIIGPVDESEGREIGEVRVVGNRIVTNEAILSQVRTQRGAAFSSRQVNLDRSRIDALGFFAQVQAQVAPNVADPQKVDVTYIVTENRVVAGFAFSGNTVVKSDDLQKALTSKSGVVLNRATVATDVKAIQDLYTGKGFAVLVQSATQLENGRILFTLLEARLSQIKLSGLTKTKPTLIRRLIRTPTGVPFDAAKLRRDLSRIYDTGFFEDATFRIDDDPNTPGAVIATYLFKEKRSGSFNVGLSFDSRSKIGGFVAVGENNLGGTGKRASVSVEAGSTRNYELDYGNPFVGKNLSSYDISIYTRTIFREPRIFQNLTGFNSATTFAERRTGGRINYAIPLDQERNNTLTFGFRNERARLSQTDAVGNPITTVTGFQNSGTVSAPSIGILRDLRDSRLEPSRGEREAITVEQGTKFLGGSSNFTKLDIDLRRYLSLSKPDKVLRTSKIVVAGRVVLGRSLNQLPAFEQYFIGGPDTVRGYNTDFQFGDNQAYGNLELRYRLNRQIQGVLFTDAGTAFGGQFTSNRNANLLTSFGFGVRLNTPIGPVRLDYGIGRNGGQTHFAIGPTF